MTEGALDLTTDDDLVRVVVSRPDFDGWYATAAPRLLTSLTLVTGDPHAAADATAEAMARALERWRRVSQMGAPEGWAYRVALNVWKRQQRRTSLGHAVMRRTTPQSEAAVDGGLPVDVRAAIAALPRRQREVLVLRLVLGLSQSETGALLDLADGTVASTLSDAKRAMRRLLSVDDPEVTS
ncbi:MAG: sigma-70 family RNA polymerase sigma factor [Acidimicrobiales bacterium]